MLHKFNHCDCSFACCDKMDSRSSCYYRCLAYFFRYCNIDFCTCENGSNPWDDIEKQTYRKRTQIILGIEIISFAVL